MTMESPRQSRMRQPSSRRRAYFSRAYLLSLCKYSSWSPDKETPRPSARAAAVQKFLVESDFAEGSRIVRSEERIASVAWEMALQIDKLLEYVWDEKDYYPDDPSRPDLMLLVADGGLRNGGAKGRKTTSLKTRLKS